MNVTFLALNTEKVSKFPKVSVQKFRFKKLLALLLQDLLFSTSTHWRSPLNSRATSYIYLFLSGRGYISWLMLVTFCYSYNAWCIVLRATFPYQTPKNTPVWMTADYLCDIVYLIDVMIVKPRLMFLHDGFWVDNLGETRKNYRRKLQYKVNKVIVTSV